MSNMPRSPTGDTPERISDLICEYKLIGISTLNACCNSGSTTVGCFNHIATEIVISHNRTSNGANTDCVAFDAHFMENVPMVSEVAYQFEVKEDDIEKMVEKAVEDLGKELKNQDVRFPQNQVPTSISDLR